jgi:tetratricopeptide (TPR) repeat protein
MRRCDEALADLDRAIELDPGNADAFVDRAKIYWRMKRYGKALAELKRAVRTKWQALEESTGPSTGRLRAGLSPGPPPPKRPGPHDLDSHCPEDPTA